MRALVVSIHDVAPSTLAEAREWRALVAEAVPGPVSLLLVPRYRGRESWRAGPPLRWARERAGDGDEIVLHGWSHMRADGREGAELAGRAAGEVAAVIRVGRGELAARGLAPAGFIAPCYAHPAGAGRSCREAGLRWWAARAALAWEGGRRALPSIGVGASTAARRALSPAATRAAARGLARAPVVRLDLHPADLRHRRLARAGREVLELLLSQNRCPVTHAAVGGPAPIA
ncbi:MAG TPA: DUF2334 domain-containing protein [Miltoncostaeaceae bacterium]|nr:DUF2334 domain-containing protein [Miltoncostaeaceae bacterium]